MIKKLLLVFLLSANFTYTQDAIKLNDGNELHVKIKKRNV
jgi:hypothetical protein